MSYKYHLLIDLSCFALCAISYYESFLHNILKFLKQQNAFENIKVL